MPIRIKFSNDLNIFGSSRGAGSFVSTPPSGGGSGFPPYGTVLDSGTDTLTLEYIYGNYPNSSGTFNWGVNNWVTIADGEGGSITGSTGVTDNYELNYVISDIESQVETRIIYLGNGNWAEYQRNGIPTGDTYTTTIFQDINDYTYGIFISGVDFGSMLETVYHDGFGGTYSTYDYNWYMSGTWLAGAGEYGSYYSDGYGGWYLA